MSDGRVYNSAAMSWREDETSSCAAGPERQRAPRAGRLGGPTIGGNWRRHHDGPTQPNRCCRLPARPATGNTRAPPPVVGVYPAPRTGALRPPAWWKRNGRAVVVGATLFRCRSLARGPVRSGPATPLQVQRPLISAEERSTTPNNSSDNNDNNITITTTPTPPPVCARRRADPRLIEKRSPFTSRTISAELYSTVRETNKQ